MRPAALLAAALSFLLCSCSTPVFHKDGATEEEFNQDMTDCEAKAGQAGANGYFPRQNFVDRCMRGQGWTRTK